MGKYLEKSQSLIICAAFREESIVMYGCHAMNMENYMSNQEAVQSKIYLERKHIAFMWRFFNAYVVGLGMCIIRNTEVRLSMWKSNRIQKGVWLPIAWLSKALKEVYQFSGAKGYAGECCWDLELTQAREITLFGITLWAFVCLFPWGQELKPVVMW